MRALSSILNSPFYGSEKGITTMKRISFTRCFAVLLTLVMLLSYAPLALADSFYYAPVVGRYTVYHSTDKNKSFYDIDVGDYVQVLGTQNYQGSTWLRVSVDYQDSKQTGFVSPAAIPSSIPTTSFVGTATATSATHLFRYFDTNKGTMTSIPAGTEVKVVSIIGDWMLVLTNGVFYGYVQSSMFSTVTTAAPVTTTAATPVAAGNSAGVTTSVNLKSQNALSKGKLASGTKLYKTNTLDDAYAYGQVQNEGTCDVYYQVDNGFYMVGTGTNNSMYAYVPAQSVTVYDLTNGMPHYAGAVDTIIVKNPNAPATATAASNTATVANCTSWVSMRSKAKSSASRVAKVPKGTTVTVLGTSGTYTKCSYDGKTGYILSTYVK